MCYKLPVGDFFLSKTGSKMLCGMAPAGGDATGWDDSGTDSLGRFFFFVQVSAISGRSFLA